MSSRLLYSLLSITATLASQVEAADAYKSNRGMSRRCRFYSAGIVTIIVLITVFLLATNRMPTFPLTSSDAAAAAAAQADVGPAAKSGETKSYIVTFTKGKETPEKFVKAAMTQFTQMGGKITHEFDTLLTGFTVSIPASVETDVMTFATDAKNLEFPFTIEEDQQVSVADSSVN
ncbi:hypothetical protein BZA70DRAFT_289090 [Myxozyma melibiosi]|uniref:Inhibitor I9 domain-containing protein n=1 Tax=Myxozyma melibiosi TaxID=54550 RepID=A0ABR1F7U4_9ASCO